ncbi:MAG: aminodeoxychorismate/anthranilate synthase component II [Opitutales bacterium]
MKLLVIDNFDSFSYNLVQYFGQLGVEQEIRRNDAVSVKEAQALEPDAILLSPGPCTPDQAGVSLSIIEAFAGKKPVLGVCLGHQCVGQFFGAKVVRAERLMHGKTSPIRHRGEELFAGLPNGFAATRYHSLILERHSLPGCLEIYAETDEGEIMAVKHRALPVWGVQFHPESLATEQGIIILQNFIDLCKNSRVEGV